MRKLSKTVYLSFLTSVPEKTAEKVIKIQKIFSRNFTALKLKHSTTSIYYRNGGLENVVFFNPFFPNAPFLCLLKTSENRNKG